MCVCVYVRARMCVRVCVKVGGWDARVWGCGGRHWPWPVPLLACAGAFARLCVPAACVRAARACERIGPARASRARWQTPDSDIQTVGAALRAGKPSFWGRSDSDDSDVGPASRVGTLQTWEGNLNSRLPKVCFARKGVHSLVIFARRGVTLPAQPASSESVAWGLPTGPDSGSGALATEGGRGGRFGLFRVKLRILQSYAACAICGMAKPCQ